MNNSNITIPIANAGLVITQSFLEVLFQRLVLLNNNSFESSEEQRKAAIYLQFLATGQLCTEEHHLILNKILCGIDIDTPIETSMVLEESDRILMNSLLKAIIQSWQSIGDISIDGFRGNWLIRDGLLTEKEDRWELIVEKRAYDLLLKQLPLSFNIVKFTWMPKPLYVVWNY